LFTTHNINANLDKATSNEEILCELIVLLCLNMVSIRHLIITKLLLRLNDLHPISTIIKK